MKNENGLTIRPGFSRRDNLGEVRGHSNLNTGDKNKGGNAVGDVGRQSAQEMTQILLTDHIVPS